MAVTTARTDGRILQVNAGDATFEWLHLAPRLRFSFPAEHGRSSASLLGPADPAAYEAALTPRLLILLPQIWVQPDDEEGPPWSDEAGDRLHQLKEAAEQVGGFYDGHHLENGLIEWIFGSSGSVDLYGALEPLLRGWLPPSGRVGLLPRPDARVEPLLTIPQPWLLLHLPCDDHLWAETAASGGALFAEWSQELFSLGLGEVVDLVRDPVTRSLTLGVAIRDEEAVRGHVDRFLQAWPLREGIRTEFVLATGDESPDGGPDGNPYGAPDGSPYSSPGEAQRYHRTRRILH